MVVFVYSPKTEASEPYFFITKGAANGKRRADCN